MSEQVKTPIQYKLVNKNLAVTIDGKTERVAIPEDFKVDTFSTLVNRYNMYYRDKDRQSVLDIVAKLRKPDLKKSATQTKRIERKKEVKKIEAKIEVAQEKLAPATASIALVEHPAIQIKNGAAYIDGLEAPLPRFVVDRMKEWLDDGLDIAPIINFTYLLASNPTEDVRLDLFRYLQDHHFQLTPAGYIVSYRKVALQSEGQDPELAAYIDSEYKRIRKMKKNANRYPVVKVDGSYKTLTPNEAAPEGSVALGHVRELFEATGTQRVFTDNHTHSMTIIVGQEVTMPRDQCDPSSATCSRGLHQMNTGYADRTSANSFGNHWLVCLVNPADIVAIPPSESYKFRCCRYFPVRELVHEDIKETVEKNIRIWDADFERVNFAPIIEALRGNKNIKFPTDDAKVVAALKAELAQYKVQLRQAKTVSPNPTLTDTAVQAILSNRVQFIS